MHKLEFGHQAVSDTFAGYALKELPNSMNGATGKGRNGLLDNAAFSAAKPHGHITLKGG
jgi:hypothetical protein